MESEMSDLFNRLDQKFDELEFGNKSCSTRLRATMKHIFRTHSFGYDRFGPCLDPEKWNAYPTPSEGEPVYVGEVVQVRMKSLLRVKNLGIRSVQLLTERLEHLGLSLGMNVSGWTPPYARNKQD